MFRLIERLPRIPFPPSTDEHYFDHEANISRVSKIEEQLTANIHSINLLRAQITKEEQLLKQDQAEVDYLEHSLKSNEVLRRDQGRTLHPIARRLGKDAYVDLLELDNGDKKGSEPWIAELLFDEEMRPVVEQLQNHLDSMQNNTMHLGYVNSVVGRAVTDVEAYAFSTLDDRAYRQAAGLASTDRT